MLRKKKLVFFYLSCLLLLACTSRMEVVERFYSNGLPELIGIFEDSLKTGEIKYYESGKKEMEGRYNKRLEREGDWVYWYENGKTWSRCGYKNGLKNGRSVVFYENGQKRYEGEYRNDSTTGIWKFWNEQGKLLKEVNYLNDN